MQRRNNLKSKINYFRGRNGDKNKISLKKNQHPKSTTESLISRIGPGRWKKIETIRKKNVTEQ